MATKQSRREYIVQTIEDCFKQHLTKQAIEEFLKEDLNQQRLTDFIDEKDTGKGSTKIFVYYQTQESGQEELKGESNSSEPILFISYGDKEKLKDKGIWFLWVQSPVKQEFDTKEEEGNFYIKEKQLQYIVRNRQMIWGEISPNSIPQLNYLMEMLYQKAIDTYGFTGEGEQQTHAQSFWDQCEEESRNEFMSYTQKFTDEVNEAIKLMAPDKDVFVLDKKEMEVISGKSEAEKQKFFESTFAKWIDTINNQLKEDNNQDSSKNKQDQGPNTELEYWRNQMQKITNFSEQLKSKDFNHVKLQITKQRQYESQRNQGEETISKLLMDYNRLDLNLTDKLNEAKDNVKYLTTLEKFIEPLYKGTPLQIIDTLPALMNAIKMIHTIARFYNTSDKMTGLFKKITNQMIENCRERIKSIEPMKKPKKEGEGPQSTNKNQLIWDMDPVKLIDTLSQCINLYKEYRDNYTLTKEKVTDMPKGKTFDFLDIQIFGKFESFVRRLQKLMEIFNNIQQFQALQRHNLEDMGKVTKSFEAIIKNFQQKDHDLLDTTQSRFDRDFVEFNVQISNLDTDLQRFIDENFQKFRNIEYSLKLLKKFETTIKRDSLKHNLTTKYNAILHNYATELDQIQRTFQETRSNPPIVRNMPQEAGKIIWARHLFQKITTPIKQFPESRMSHTDIKRYYGSYNSLGKQLTIYEMFFFQNWVNEIERSKAALQATLIVRHDDDTKLYVNFDVEIMQLIREAKCLDRQPIEIPESARIILLQEEKFKMYFNELQYALKEHERIISKIKPICKTLLSPHIDDLELKLRPGMVTLTWTSMNIDSYLLHVHSGLKKLEQLIINVNDIIENRIENNLKEVSKVILVDLPTDTKPFALQDFVTKQEAYIETKTAQLKSKNIEVERSVDDLLQTIQQYPLDPHLEAVSLEEAKRIKRYYFWYFYQALLNATQNSLNAMKYRVCGKKIVGQVSLTNLKPFFVVDVQLQANEVVLNPSLNDIQSSINKAATAVLRCSKHLYSWEDRDKTFYDMIAQDKEIVKVILLLTGSIQGTKNKVNDFLATYKKYEDLSHLSITEQIKKFQASKPTLQMYEDKLKHYANIEEEIDKQVSVYKIGAMELQTMNICAGFKKFAVQWKGEYANRLHKEGKQNLEALTDEIKNFQLKLTKDLTTIKQLGEVMQTLEQIRKKQSQIDMEFNPIQETYSLLDKYLTEGIVDKDEQDQRSMLQNNWFDLIKKSEEKSKELMEKQSDSLKTLKNEIRQQTIDIKEFRIDYQEKGPMVEGITPEQAMERLKQFKETLDIKLSIQEVCARGEQLFGLQVSKYVELEQTQRETETLSLLYRLYGEVIDYLAKFKDKTWHEITRDELNNVAEQIEKYKLQVQKLPKILQEWMAYKNLKTLISNLTEQIPIIVDLKKQSILNRHWQDVCKVTGKDLKYETPEAMTIEDLLGANLLENKDDITDITEAADKQKKIHEQLQEITCYWQDKEFEFSNWGTYEKPIKLNGLVVADITEKLEEDLTNLSTLNAQRHVTPFKAEVEEKIKIYLDMSETLELWIKVQQLWSSLQPVFTAGDIANQMPKEAKQFKTIDKTWVQIMAKASDQKKAVACCQNDMLKDWLPILNKDLEGCQQKLENYLEGKRKKFPRFYFVSGPNLLKILSSGSNPKQVRSDFEKLFDAITDVEFGTGPQTKDKKKKKTNEVWIDQIMQQMGQDYEKVHLHENNVKCEGNIESWLKQLETNMCIAVKDLSRSGCKKVVACNGSTQLMEFMRDEKSQIALMGLQVLWTARLEEGLNKSQSDRNGFEKKKSEIKAISEMLSELCLSDSINTKILRQKIETLVTIQVHQYDITKELKCKVADFDWQKQTRMYWKNDLDQCIISITDWDSRYSYEFLGSKERLCITPLTDRCYITLAQAMSMHYGGAPAGPAGTGKTETVKDLGRTLGVFVVVTNCSDQHRYKDMAKIFKGLVQSGLWGCFDEFNRIDLEVLSVVAMQIESITAARKAHQTQFQFPEEENLIDLVNTVSYFITMNPGYAGRQELPENLKVLFRGVSMMVPDRQIIIKVKLASVGYREIEPLSLKFHILYQLCEEQLSKQRHYDFGLRNILSVLRTAGNTLREEMNAEEELLLARSLRDMNLSKLVQQDIGLFNGLLLDIFPKQSNIAKREYPNIENMIPIVAEDRSGEASGGNFIIQPSFALKIIQLYETCRVRHGYMILGPTGTGKSTIMNILTDCLTKTGQKTVIQKMNPKAITAEQMYGIKSDVSDDWIQGVFSALWTKFNDRSKPQNTWITCDGPVDAIWIENLNTVLDDNKILTLANGDRILMTDNTKLVFEVENLNNASPATVSRCGQVYVSPFDLKPDIVMKGWLQYRKTLKGNDEFEKLTKYFTQYYPMLAAADTFIKEAKMGLSEVIQVVNICNVVTGCLKMFENTSRTPSDKEMEMIVVFGYLWGIGGVCDQEDRKLIQKWLLEKSAPIPSKLMQEHETVYDFFIDSSTGEWTQFVGEEWKPAQGGKKITQLNFSQILMPTVESTRTSYLLDLVLTNQNKSALCRNAGLLIGESGTAKTSCVLMYANTFKKERLFKRTNFSSATLPHMFQATIEAECDTKDGLNFGPPIGKTLDIFIDDIAMPFMNNWGDQITLEIVRQLIEQYGFYLIDPNSRGTFKSLKNLSYIGAMQHPGGGRNDIPNRLKRQFFMFNLILPTDIEPIYKPIIKHQLFNMNPKVKLDDACTKVVNGMTTATVNLWKKVKQTMLPTPSKFHYVFNMRDLSRIFKGVLQVQKEIINKSQKSQSACKPDFFLVALWKHECERVFVDKLINNKDKEQVMGFIKDICLQTDDFAHLSTDIEDRLFAEKKNFLFLNFIQPDILDEDGNIEEEAPKLYDGITDIEALRARCNQLLGFYNSQPGKNMPLVLFDDALKHLLRISRTIIQPRSSFLLVGVGGSGKQSLTRLASYINKSVCLQIQITKNYNERELKEDIKTAFEQSGHAGKQVTFLMTDAEVKKEDFLEYINMVLSTGEIPNLLAKDEKDTWLGDLQTQWQKENKGIEPTAAFMYNLFVDKVRDNIHIGLAFSPVGYKFRERSRKFPALFNECTIDWFLPWPEEALISVAETYIKSFTKLDTTDEIKHQLTKHMGNVHLLTSQVCELYFQQMRRQNYVTPKSYLSYLSTYQEIYAEKYDELDKQGNNYKIGVEKIEDSAQKVEKMGIELQEKQKILNQKTEEVNAMLEKVQKEQADAQVIRDECQKTSDSCEAKAQEIDKKKTEAEEDLKAAEPAMLAAQSAVDNLKQADINTMKANKKPLPIIKLVFDPVSILFQSAMTPVNAESFTTRAGTFVAMKDSWVESSLRILSDNNFMFNLKNFKRNEINDETIELLQPYIDRQNEWYNAESVMAVSSVAVSVYKWATAVRDYHNMSKIVKPKIAMLKQQEGLLDVAKKELDISRARLKEIEDQLETLQQILQKQTDEKNELESDASKTRNRIKQATNLIQSLTGEKNRWSEGLTQIKDNKKKLVGNSSLSSAFISYCGPFNSEYRQLLKEDYFIRDMKNKGVPLKLDLNLTQFLVDESEVGEWNIQGLPKDDLSVQNGIMVKKSTRYCLIIDPQLQGQNWIKNKEEKNMGLRSITTLLNPKFRDQCLKPAMENGTTLIIESIENEVDNVMDPVLDKNFMKRGKKLICDVGGTEIEYDNKFRLYMFCRLSNPAFSPELSAKTTIIDFTVTQKGLEQQLLGSVISREQKQLEQDLNNLLLEINKNKKGLMQLDEDLLMRLCNSTGNLLDDTKLIEVLNNTKTKAKEVKNKLQESDIQTKEINERRELYRDVAIRGSALYFTIIEVALVNWMYNSSLDQFNKLFYQAIEQAEKSNKPSTRVNNISETLTYITYKYVNRGLFEKDKVSFILMICFKILTTSKKINSNDISMFLKSGASLDIKNERGKPSFAWLNEKAWLNVVALSKHSFGGDNNPPVLKGLMDSLTKFETQWNQWMQKTDPENSNIPDNSIHDIIEGDKDIGPFIKMCIIRALREDRTKICTSKFIEKQLGEKFIKPLSYPITDIFADTSNVDPILYLLSAGADPTSSIDELAKKKKKHHVEKVSMGEGQERAAEKAIDVAFENGGWVILQNCHLGLKFMEKIESIVNIQEHPNIHEEFRLWITCEQHPQFPLGLLQKTLKVTNEPPIGIKAGLNKTFSTLITQEFIDKHDTATWRNLLYTTCFLHSIVIERRKFGPLGWCIPYEFNNSDLEASLLFIEKFLLQNQTSATGGHANVQPNLKVIQYMVCQVQYGGRITDDLDRELFTTYGEDYFKEAINTPNHHFVQVDNEGSGKFQYKIPDSKNCTEVQKYLEFIENNIPAYDNPEVFGLNKNADLTFRLKESMEMINTLVDTRPKESSTGGGKTREEIVYDKAKELLQNLPDEFNRREVNAHIKNLGGPKNYPDKGMQVPLNIFLSQEIDRMQKVLSIVRKCFKDVGLAIEGTIIMTPDILDAINAIYDAKVPNQWLYDPSGAEISWLLPTLGSWYASLTKRNQQLNEWIKGGRPECFWLAYFFNPQGFLTAMKQEVTRMHKEGKGGQEAWSLDNVQYESQVKEREMTLIKDIKSDGVYIQGLILEGCDWEKNGLAESKPKKTTANLPILHVTAVNKPNRSGQDKETGTYDCPVYKYPRRNDKYLIFRVKLPCEGTHSTVWKTRGVALLCSIE